MFRTVSNAAVLPGPTALNNSNVVGPDIGLNGIIGLTVRRDPGLPLQVAGVTGAQLPLAGLNLLDGGPVSDHERHPEEVPVTLNVAVRLTD